MTGKNKRVRRTLDELARQCAQRVQTIREITHQEGGCEHASDDYEDGFICSTCSMRQVELAVEPLLRLIKRDTIRRCVELINEHMEHAHPLAGPDGDHKVVSCMAKLRSDVAALEGR